MKKALLGILFLINVIPLIGQASRFEWATNNGGISVMPDGNGNIYSVYPIMKSDENGNVLWTKQFNSTGSFEVVDATLDINKNILITGRFSHDSVDFDPGAGTFTLHATASLCYFIVKLDSNGIFLWAKQINGVKNWVESISADLMGNVYTTGSYRNTVDFNPGLNVFNQTSISPLGDIFIHKLDPTGNFKWVKSIGSLTNTSLNNGKSITLDSIGNSYTTGTFGDIADFDPSIGNYTLISNGASDIFILKLDSLGSFIWAQSYGSIDYDYGNSINIDRSNNILSTGTYHLTIDFDPGPGVNNLVYEGSTAGAAGDAYIQKSDSAGNFLWAKSVGGTKSDVGYTIDSDNSNNVFVSGIFQDTVDFDPGSGIFNLNKLEPETGTLDGDIFTLKLDGNGNFMWVKQIECPGHIGNYPKEISIDENNNIYTTGRFCDTVDFNPALLDTSNLICTWSNVQFIQKLSECNSPSFDTIIYAGCHIPTYNNQIFYQSGIYHQNLLNAAGCDSLLTLDLNVNVVITSISDQGCHSYTLNNETYTQSGDYVQILSNIVNCDSVINLHLIVFHPSSYVIAMNGYLTSPIPSQFGSFQWINCSDNYAIIPGATSQNFYPQDTLSYALIFTDGCSDTSICYSIQGVSLSENITEKNIVLFPNPNNGEFTVNIQNGKSKDYHLSVLSITGKEIFSVKMKDTENEKINLSHLSAGIYFVKVIGDNGNARVTKVIINK